MRRRVIPLCQMPKKKLLILIEAYPGQSKIDSETDTRLYLDYRYNNYSTLELADREHMDRVTVYRKIKRVDEYLRQVSSVKDLDESVN